MTPDRTPDRTPDAPRSRARRPRLHQAWPVAAVTFLTLVAAASFRATPSVFIVPLHEEFGWPRSTISAAVSVNLVLFGVTSPFAAALMERFGIRRVVTIALIVVSAGSYLTVFMTQSWQLIACWGVLVGLGTGSMSMALVATVTNRWFVKRRGLVTGILTAGTATGQLIFLPIVARIVEGPGWRTASVTVAIAAATAVPLVLWLMRDRPQDVGLRAYGAPTDTPDEPVVIESGGAGRAAVRAIQILVWAAKQKPFWLLAGGFAVCGATTVGLVSVHFIPAAHDHGMPETTAAGLLALIGLLDIAGTIASGYLTDRVNPRILLALYYTFRGLSLAVLPLLFSETTKPSMWLFIIFYGLDWVATVPPTVALCRECFGPYSAVVFGWVFASHQVGAGIAAFLAGFARDELGNYNLTWHVAGVLCLLAAGLSLGVRAAKQPQEPFVPAVSGG